VFLITSTKHGKEYCLAVSPILWLHTVCRCVCVCVCVCVWVCVGAGGRWRWSPASWHYVRGVCPSRLHPTSHSRCLFGSQNLTHSPLFQSPQVTLQYTISTKTVSPKAVNCRHFMQPASSLPCSQQPAALLYPDPDQFRPRPLILFIYKPFQYYPFLYT
jgi:hypothetical protein